MLASNVTLKYLIALAYHVRLSQIVGGPTWIDAVRWDIEGKVKESSIPDPAGPTVMLMTQHSSDSFILDPASATNS